MYLQTVDVALLEIAREYEVDDAPKGFLPGFDREERAPWVVSYSGGKDSTLLLTLILETARRKSEINRPIWVVFSDTGIEQDGISERIERNFEGLREFGKRTGVNVTPVILKPDRSWKYFNTIIGRGYCVPDMVFRWCSSRLKTDDYDAWKGRQFRRRAFRTLSGERATESDNRRAKVEALYPPGRKTVFFRDDKCRRGELRWLPIRNVSTEHLWRYLANVGVFPWGETFEELLAQYDATSAQEILDDPRERRSGCRFCIAGKNCRARRKEEEAFLEWALGESRKIERRYYLEPDALKSCKLDRYDKDTFVRKVGMGKFSIEARQELLARLREMERATGRVWIDAEDEAFIRRQWELDQERIARGELVDARIALAPGSPWRAALEGARPLLEGG